MNKELTFRDAKRKDTPLILQFIKELADYEKMSDEVVADADTLETWIFDKQKAEVILRLKTEKKSDLHSFFITSRHSSAVRVFILKTCM